MEVKREKIVKLTEWSAPLEEMKKYLSQLKELSGPFESDSDLLRHLQQSRGRVSWAYNSHWREQAPQSRKNNSQLILCRDDRFLFNDAPICVDLQREIVFPDEILLKIFGFLDPFSLVKAGTICKEWNNISKDEFLWKRMCFCRWKKTQDKFSKTRVWLFFLFFPFFPFFLFPFLFFFPFFFFFFFFFFLFFFFFFFFLFSLF